MIFPIGSILVICLVLEKQILSALGLRVQCPLRTHENYYISVPIYSTFTQGVCRFKPIKSCWHGQEVGFVLRSRWKSHENNAIYFFQSLRNNPNLFKMSTSSCPPCQPAIDVEPMTLTRFILAEQKKHPHATGDFTALMNFIQTAVKAVSSAVRKAGIHSL